MYMYFTSSTCIAYFTFYRKFPSPAASKLEMMYVDKVTDKSIEGIKKKNPLKHCKSPETSNTLVPSSLQA